MKYDYLVVGSGLYGAIFAHEAKAHGKSVLVVDKRPHIAGNIYTENIEGINVHKYGAHIFHTNDKKVWNYITQFAEFNRFTNSVFKIIKYRWSDSNRHGLLRMILSHVRLPIPPHRHMIYATVMQLHPTIINVDSGIKKIARRGIEPLFPP